MQDLVSIQKKLNDDLFAVTQEKCLALCRVQDITKKSKEKSYILCACSKLIACQSLVMDSNRETFYLTFPSEYRLVYQKAEPQPSLYLVRFSEKANEIPKKKATVILSDVKTIDYSPTTADKRHPSSLVFDLRTADREYSFLTLTSEEKKEFFTNLTKVRCSSPSHSFVLLRLS